jgi:oligopeptide transport system ATP-binding protein
LRKDDSSAAGGEKENNPMEPIHLDVRGLKKHFPVLQGVFFKKAVGWVKAVDGVSFSLNRGETLGIVGESGSGKTTIARLILLLEKPTSGEILFAGQGITQMKGEKLRGYRQAIQPVFQDPSSSLSPRMRVASIVAEPVKVSGKFPAEEIQERVIEALHWVGLPPDAASLFPNEFSGGQMQRIAIARALCSHPDFIILDEPVSSLDVSIRAQIINLLTTLQERFGHSYILISHDLAIAAYMCTKIAVMYLGKIVEMGPSEEISSHPVHPYSRALFSAALPQHPRDKGGDALISGEIPSPLNPPAGCHFHPRCACAKGVCSEADPPFLEVSGGHYVTCHHPPESR